MFNNKPRITGTTKFDIPGLLEQAGTQEYTNKAYTLSSIIIEIIAWFSQMVLTQD